MGKARVAPLKQMTIPHMELAAAVLSVKVDKMMCTELQLKLDDLVFWIDSHSVLKCIANEHLTQEPSVLIPTLTEGEPATLTCTAPGTCSGTPPHITWTWRGTGDNITELRENTTIQKREDLTSVTTTHFSNLTFTPSAKHHGTKVTCLVTFNGSVTTKKTLKLNVTQEVSKDILAVLLNPPLIAAFVIGAALSATISCIFLCLTGKCKKRKERTPKDLDSKSPLTNLEMVACEDQQRDAGQAVMGEQTHLQVELREGTENGGLQTSGASGHSAPGEEPKEVTTPVSTTPY
ncbi:myeloid cell surface antigen CD33-like [Salvelinus alpinus]|uniref:myeloid cell surface antigen CD33-like n=1 Tax=Salvelinus alpinus TaxID=8036 RepID=UPI0039FC4073